MSAVEIPDWDDYIGEDDPEMEAVAEKVDADTADKALRSLGRIFERENQVRLLAESRISDAQRYIARLEGWKDEQLAEVTKRRPYLEHLVQVHHEGVIASYSDPSKAPRTIALPHGRSVMKKKPDTTDIADPDRMEAWVRANRPDLIEDIPATQEIKTGAVRTLAKQGTEIPGVVVTKGGVEHKVEVEL